MVTWSDFWDINKVWYALVGAAITAFLSVGAVYLAWWINDGYGIILMIILILLALAGGSAVLTKEKEVENE